jgi:hypothetical protein
MKIPHRRGLLVRQKPLACMAGGRQNQAITKSSRKGFMTDEQQS